MKRSSSQVKWKNKFNTRTSLTNISCLVTGFDSFNDADHNPSADIAMTVPSYLHLKKGALNVSIENMILPTVGNKAWSILKRAIDRLPSKTPSVLIMLGQAANRKVIGLERFALNFRDYSIEDNTGRRIVAKPIDVRAPEAIRTKAPVEGALEYLISKGLPVEASNHAGTFICNETYFRALYYINQLRLPHIVYFVHVPLPRIYGKALAKSKMHWSELSSGKENQLAVMTEAIKLLIQFSAESIGKK